MKTLTAWSLAAGMVCSLLTANTNAATWKGAAGASGTLFDNAANWSDALPGAGAALTFSANAAGGDGLYNDLTGASFGSITFNGGAPAYTISGNVFTWNNNSTLTNNSGRWQTIANNILMPGAATYIITGSAGSNVALTGTISGAGALTIQNKLAAGSTLTVGAVNISSGGFSYQADKNGLTAVFGDINAASAGLNLNSVNRAYFTTVWFTGSNQFAVNQKGSLNPMALYLDYRSSNYGKFTGLTGGFDMYGTEIHLLGGSTVENVGFLNASANAYRASVLIDRGGVAGTSAILSSAIWDGSCLYDLSDSALLGSTTNGNSNGIVSAWITIGQNQGAGRDFAYRHTDNLFYTYTDYAALGSANAANALVNGNLSLSAATTANSLKLTAGAGGRLDLGGNTLTLTSGGVIYDGTGDYTVGGDTGASGVINSGNNDLVIWSSGVGKLVINANLNSSGKGLRIAGGGGVELNGTNNGTGATAIDIDNYVKLGADQAIARGALYLSISSTLDLNGHSQKVSAFAGGNINIGSGLITNSDLVNTATLTIGALDGPAGSTATGLSNHTLSGNIHLVLSGSMNASNTNINRKLNITGGVEFKDIAATTPVRSVADSYWYMPFFDFVNFISGTTGALSFSGNGAVQFTNNSGSTISNPLAVTGTNNLLSTGFTANFSGPLTVAAGADLTFAFNSRTANAQTLTFSGAMNDVEGTLFFSSQGGANPQEYVALTQGAANLANGKVVLSVAGDATARAITLQATQTGTYHIGELSTENYAAGSTTLNAADAAIVRSAVNAPVTFAIGGGVFDGHITNSATSANGVITDVAAGTNPVSLEKVGTGTLTLTNLSTYTGTTTVSGGVLLLSGAADLSRTSAVTVSGGTLALSGNAVISSNARVGVDSGVLLVNNSAFATAGKNLDINAGGVLGGSGVISTEEINFASGGITGGGLGAAGTLTFSGEQMWEPFTYYFDILSESVHDLLNFTGAGLDLELGGPASFTLNVNNLGGLSEFNDVTIISGLNLSYFGKPEDVLGLWSLPSDEYTLSLNGNNLLLSYASIPEPSTWLLLSLGGAALLLTLRRRR